MKLDKTKLYQVSGDVLQRVLDVLQSNWFDTDVNGESYNNAPIINAQSELEEEIKRNNK